MDIKKSLFALLGAVLVIAVVYQIMFSQSSVVADESLVKRGEYLVNLGGCHDCHTPKKMTEKGMEFDMSRQLSGHPQDGHMTEFPSSDIRPGGWTAATNMHLSEWAGPWGISYAANLTPDKFTGIGNWTEDTFIQVMRTGKQAGVGRPILPPMPWQNLSAVTDEDLKAMFAYFMSIKPIENQVPQPEPPGEYASASK
jgi:mono/diheme cytochrome c family protein